MDMFAVDDDVAHWEAALLPLRGPARLPVLVPLAWHLRQRDTMRAVALATEGRQLLPATALSQDDMRLVSARLLLVQAEAIWLAGELDDAAVLAEQAYEQLCQLGDHQGCADAHWLRAWIAIDRGDHRAGESELELMAAAARQAGDAQRADIAEAAIARWAVLQDHRSAERRWGQRFATDQAPQHPGAAAWVYDFFGLSASQHSDHGAAARHYIHCYETALETGQVRMAVIAAINIGLNFTILNDHHSALEWMQSALDLARPTGWPRSIGACLMHTAETMRRLGRLDATEELLHEALQIMTPLPGARSYAHALSYLGDLALDKADYPGALNAFHRMAGRADALGQADFQSIARRGQAHALCFLDRPQEALEMAERAVELAAEQANRDNHVAALRVLSVIHERHALPPPAGMTEQNATLHYLHQALEVASAIDGYTLPGDLHDALGREYARVGDYAKAYAAAQAAAAARQKTHSQEATNRAIAMQVHHQTEHARAEGLHHRELAASEARRAEVLQQTSATLERLSAIGQEITTHLDAAAVFQALTRHVQGLLPANSFAIYLCDAGGETVSRAFGIENGHALPTNTIDIDNPRANSARCVRERREIYVEEAGPDDIFLAPGTELMVSALYVPLLVGERALGVMTVQAMHARAYGERERLIFRTLCAYGAIALDNAEAYRQLKDAQTQLVSQEKLAALGSLMAGVAHELNTPIGNSLLIASTLIQKTEELETQVNGAGLRRSELANYLSDARKAHELVMRGLTSAADLVNSFKQVAVDRTTEQRREFNLQQVSHEVIATMMNRIRAANHRIEIEVPELISMDSYPGPFGQVIANFINNALLHAFARERSGGMWLHAATPAEGRVLITFRDNGGGIAPEHMSRIFDPFFTTKLGQGGSGLGLSISYNIVTSLLGGHISVHSSRDGTVFTLDLPVTAPEHQTAAASQIYT
ncbi:ATP-binding protein [Duganella violaceipulchra]|uniref:GAF domain-containing protein n=1 Tax=Duganella violaceipulchra TaxID=2849652 RepID=A0AA41HB57_9BURK|nr:ATP-binding protein [Duganella violaceicalia]MBV6325312.1 GAF domain-containing protein [Duganella violaceicalia]MCP2009809.1 signal transduction histidine kinase [Duganella violaceicalia]